MQNPFTTTFSKTPEYTYIHTEKTEEILENFIYDNPSESVYKITGVRGSGKTVILAKVEEELRTNESRYINWLVFDVNPARDILGQIAAMLVKAGFGSQDKKTTGINLSATMRASCSAWRATGAFRATCSPGRFSSWAMQAKPSARSRRRNWCAIKNASRRSRTSRRRRCRQRPGFSSVLCKISLDFSCFYGMMKERRAAQ